MAAHKAVLFLGTQCEHFNFS